MDKGKEEMGKGLRCEIYHFLLNLNRLFAGSCVQCSVGRFCRVP
jgi:hypothetical protein